MLSSHLPDQLIDIPGPTRFRYLTSLKDKAKFALRHRIVSWVPADLIPDEPHGGPFESPGFPEFYGLIQMGAGCP